MSHRATEYRPPSQIRDFSVPRKLVSAQTSLQVCAYAAQVQARYPATIKLTHYPRRDGRLPRLRESLVRVWSAGSKEVRTGR
jgi:hypothetical protein